MKRRILAGFPPTKGLIMKKPHGNVGNRHASVPEPKRSLTIRLLPVDREKAMARPEGASEYIGRLIREDKG